MAPFAESSRIPEDIKYRIAAVPGVAQVAPLSFQTIQVERNGKPFRFFLMGYDLNSFGWAPLHYCRAGVSAGSIMKWWLPRQ